MGIGVHVREYSGAEVARLDRPVDVNRLCAVAGDHPARYPLLSGVDDHDDTYFNARQARRLEHELKLIGGDPALREAAEAISLLAGLLQAAPGRPHHRLLVFVGD